MSYGYVYKFTFIPTGKIYVGKHRYSNRILDEDYFGSGTLWNNEINNYISSNSVDDLNKIIKRDILEWCDTCDELNDKEIFWIKELNSCDRDIGYNIASGGNGGTGKYCKWYNDGQNEFYINTLFEVHDKDLIKGRLKERFKNIGLNTVWINNGSIQKHCNKEEAKKFIDLGWSKGMIYRGDEWRRKCGHSISESQRKICSETAKKTIREGKNLGWVLNQFKKGQIPHNKNKIWITDGTKNAYINHDDIIPDGWYRGCTQRRKGKN